MVGAVLVTFLLHETAWARKFTEEKLYMGFWLLGVRVQYAKWRQQAVGVMA